MRLGWSLPPLLVLAAASPALAQSADVEGRVRDEEGAPVFAALVSFARAGSPVLVAETDSSGYYLIERLDAGSWRVRVERIGYAAVEREVEVAAGVRLRLELVISRQAVDVEGVSVEAARARERIRFGELAGATVRELGLEELRRIPGVAETDPLRAVEVLPGVVSTSDLSSTFHVRGGSADQNLVLLDGVPIFNPFHLGGFFSVFNADMVERVELHSGGFAARHGGRVSSVLAVESNPGDGRFRVDGGVSLLALRAAVAGGLSDGAERTLGLRATRWRLGVRRSYFDKLLEPVFEFPYHLADVQGSFEGETAGGGRLSVTGYAGEDVLDFRELDVEDFPLRVLWSWGNQALGARWQRTRPGRGSLALLASFARFGTELGFPDFGDTRFDSRIHQASAAADLELPPGRSSRSRAGLRADRFSYDNLATSGGTVFGEGRGTGWLLGGYGQVDWHRSSAWLVEAGARVDGWLPEPGDAVWVLSPRVAAKRFFAGSHWAVKGAVGRYAQFLHSIRDEELPLGLDVWVLSGARAPHVVSDQVQVGVEGYPQEKWHVALEGFHRTFDGVVTFNVADDPNDPLDDILAGRGTSWGADLLLRRTEGEVAGWLALSFLRARRTFPDLLSPETPRPEITYAPIFDRRLDLDLVLRFPAPRGWEGGLRFNLGSGVPYTRPLASFASYEPRFVGGGRLAWRGATDESDTFGSYSVFLGERNGERYPPYHRLDVSLRKTYRKSWGSLTPHLDVLNIYNRKNVLFYFFEYDRDPPRRSGISMFPFLPTIGLEASFR